MAQYSFTIKKFDITLEICSSDSAFVAKEMDKWMKYCAGNVPKANIPVSAVKKPDINKNQKPIDVNLLNKMQEYTPGKSSKEIEKTPEVELSEAEVLRQDEESVNKLSEKQEQEENKVILAEKDVPDSAEELVSQISEEQEKIKSIEKAIKNVSQKVQQTRTKQKKVKDQEEVVEDSQDLDFSEQDVSEDEGIENKSDTNKFYEILQKKISSIPEAIEKAINDESSDAFDNVSDVRAPNDLSEVKTLEDLINLKKPKTLLDYLVITAYYLKEYENLDRYSLKQINAKVMNFTQMPIDHAVIQKAVVQNYLEVVPDFTGMAGVTEYQITEEGDKYLLNDL